MELKFKESISNEELDVLPLLKFEGRIEVVDTYTQAQHACNALKKYHLLGFDTETKPTFKKGRLNDVCLIQISNQSESYIFRINKIGIPDELIELFVSMEHKKIGVAIRDDINQLSKIKKFQPHGFIDLQSIAGQYGIAEKGLKKMAGIVLGGRISKSQRTSNWESVELTVPQLVYAATDSWACLKIYEQLLRIQ